jgi:hypothetical protein
MSKKRSSRKIEVGQITHYFWTLSPLSILALRRSVLSMTESWMQAQQETRERTEEQYKMDTLQKGIGADLCEELQRVVDPIRSRVFF